MERNQPIFDAMQLHTLAFGMLVLCSTRSVAQSQLILEQPFSNDTRHDAYALPDGGYWTVQRVESDTAYRVVRHAPDGAPVIAKRIELDASLTGSFLFTQGIGLNDGGLMFCWPHNRLIDNEQSLWQPMLSVVRLTTSGELAWSKVLLPTNTSYMGGGGVFLEPNGIWEDALGNVFLHVNTGDIPFFNYDVLRISSTAEHLWIRPNADMNNYHEILPDDAGGFFALGNFDLKFLSHITPVGTVDWSRQLTFAGVTPPQFTMTRTTAGHVRVLGQAGTFGTMLATFDWTSTGDLLEAWTFGPLDAPFKNMKAHTRADGSTFVADFTVAQWGLRTIRFDADMQYVSAYKQAPEAVFLQGQLTMRDEQVVIVGNAPYSASGQQLQAEALWSLTSEPVDMCLLDPWTFTSQQLDVEDFTVQNNGTTNTVFAVTEEPLGCTVKVETRTVEDYCALFAPSTAVADRMSEQVVTLQSSILDHGSDILLRTTRPVHVALLNAHGSVVRRMIVRADRAIIPTTDLARGLYLVQVAEMDDRPNSTLKLVVQ